MRRLSIACLAFAWTFLAAYGGDTSALRRIRLTDFRSRTGSLTLGGEMPGAKGGILFKTKAAPPHVAIDFDLSNGGAYTGWDIPVSIEEGARSFTFRVRSPDGARRNIYFRMRDSTRQYFFQDRTFSPTGEWNDVTFDVAAFKRHWLGAKDGRIHWPCDQLSVGFFSGRGTKKGSYAFCEAVMETSAAKCAMPTRLLYISCPDRLGSVFRGDEPARLLVTRQNLVLDTASPVTATWTVSDYKGCQLSSGRLPRSEGRGTTDWRLDLTPADVKGLFGAFQLDVCVEEEDGNGPELKAKTWFARLDGPDPAPCSWIGTQITSIGKYFDRGDYSYLDLLRPLGIGVVRGGEGWRGWEREKGKIVLPENLDRYLTALNARGIELMYLLCAKNPLYGERLDIPAFTRWAAAVAGSLKGRVRLYEVWNEPQNFTFRQEFSPPGGDDRLWVEAFTRFSRGVTAALRKANPDAYVAVCSEDLHEMLAYMLEKGITDPGNAVSFHPYAHAQIRPEREMFFRDGGAEYRRILSRHGGVRGFWITENGWTTYKLASDNPFATRAGSYPCSSLEDQARYLVRAYLLSREYGCDMMIQFCFSDRSRREHTEHNWGFIHEDLTPKPSLAAVAAMARRVGHAEPHGDLTPDPEGLRLARFRQADGSETVVGWSIEGRTSCALPAGFDASKLRVRDMFGNPIAAPLAEGRLVLDENPVYMDGPDWSSFTNLPRVVRDKPRAKETRPFSFWGGNVYRKDGRLYAPIGMIRRRDYLTNVVVRAEGPLVAGGVSEARIELERGVNSWRVPLTALPSAGRDQLAVTCRLCDGVEMKRTFTLRSATVPRMARPSFTGKESEWKDARPLAATPAWKGRPNGGAECSSVLVKAGWCEDGMMVCVRVRDDVFFQPFTNHGDPRGADAVELGLSRDGTASALTVTVAQLGERVHVDLAGGLGGHSSPRPTAAVTPTGEAGGRFYEILVPWGMLPETRSMGIVRLAVKVYDHDGDGEGLKGVWRLHEGLDGEVNGHRFGLYTLD